MFHRRFWLLAVMVAGMALFGLAPATAQEEAAQEEAAPEMRASWVARMHWTRGTQEETQDRIRTIMETLAGANFNAVLFQVRGECNTLYPSPYEPWGPQFNWTDPGWDPLEYAIEQARANNLEFHAYFNTHTLTAVVPPEETTPQHPFNLHGPEAEDSWVIHNEAREPVARTDSYVWISPGHAGASAHVRKVLMHLVENYDIDGVHFDRIRTPGPGYSYDPMSVTRFEGDGNPDGTEWGDFMRDAITRDLRRIYGGIALRKPHVKVTAAPFGIVKRVPGGYQGSGTQSYYAWHQDSWGWLESGVVDAIFPMIYWAMGSAHPFEVLLADFLRNSGGRHVYAGIHAGRGPIEQIEETRRQGGPGSTIWSYTSTDFDAFLAGPYAEPAPIPAMPWKDEPTTAIVAGTVTDANDEPVLDAWIWVRGDSYTYLSGADGFYSILNLEPGTHTITVQKNGVGQMMKTVAVEAGDVLQVDFRLPSTAAAAARMLDDAKRLAGSNVTRLHPEYVQAALDEWRADNRITAALQNALGNGDRQGARDLIRAVELKFIHDPETSALDLLEPEQAELYRNFDWDPADYPGGPEGPNEDMARDMVEALRVVLPERRANSGHDPAVRRSEATEEVWDYMVDQWVHVPGQERYMLNHHARDSFVKMREQAKREGVDLIIRSAHRTRARAEAGAARAGNPYAVASFSSHSLGLAIDFQMSHRGRSFREVTTRPMSEVVRMRESPVHKWLFLRGEEFGWYAYMHEPWHWEYNPPGFRPVFWADFPGGAPEPPETE